MRCPTLRELPPPPPGKTGWPWTEETQPLPDTMPDGGEWPKISIVTPNYNYGRFIEETIRSVLLQGYPNLEYIVIDGGSTDDSVEIIKKYEPWLSYWVSEKDKGQANAINKGLTQCKGKIFNWINSDDQLLPNALLCISNIWSEKKPHLIIGRSYNIEFDSRTVLREWHPRTFQSPIDLIVIGQLGLGISQPSTFIDTDLVKQVGGVNEKLNYAFDCELYFQISLMLRKSITIVTIHQFISQALDHPRTKVNTKWSEFVKEMVFFTRTSSSQLFLYEKCKLKFHTIKELSWLSVIEVKDYNRKKRFFALVGLLIRSPYVMLSRFFWGALKRTII